MNKIHGIESALEKKYSQPHTVILYRNLRTSLYESVLFPVLFSFNITLAFLSVGSNWKPDILCFFFHTCWWHGSINARTFLNVY